MGLVVVGVDGSAGSVEALRVAFEEAKRRGAGVKIVNAWHISPIVYESAWAGVPVDREMYPKWGDETIEKALADANTGETGIEVTKVVREGQAADVICEEAKGAELLVVGSRGLGGFRGLLLGSVSQQCAHYSPCPILIVRAPD
jgi:nucleotide-binding universal stress UspA family protein